MTNSLDSYDVGRRSSGFVTYGIGVADYTNRKKNYH